MDKLVGGLLPALIIVCAAWLVVSFVSLAKKWTHDQRRRSPFTGDFLRNPGHTLLTQLEDARLDFMGYVAASMSMPLVLFSVPVTQAWWSHQPITTGAWVWHGVIGVVLTAALGVKLVQTMRRVQQLRLGYEGELAVGQELNQLLCRGFRVYHDFPADGFNVDHVVIGPTGVFAVETKARRKPVTRDRSADARVDYTGQYLQFPSWSDQKILAQADRQAQWLSRWLSNAVGESVPVRAAVALPGWYITQTGRGDALVFNGKRPDMVFPKIHGKGLSGQMIQRVAHQVEAKCRDVSPNAYENHLKDVS
jgi:hypothetical protein